MHENLHYEKKLFIEMWKHSHHWIGHQEQPGLIMEKEIYTGESGNAEADIRPTT